MSKDIQWYQKDSPGISPTQVPNGYESNARTPLDYSNYFQDKPRHNLKDPQHSQSRPKTLKTKPIMAPTKLKGNSDQEKTKSEAPLLSDNKHEDDANSYMDQRQLLKRLPREQEYYDDDLYDLVDSGDKHLLTDLLSQSIGLYDQVNRNKRDSPDYEDNERGEYLDDTDGGIKEFVNGMSGMQNVEGDRGKSDETYLGEKAKNLHQDFQTSSKPVRLKKRSQLINKLLTYYDENYQDSINYDNRKSLAEAKATGKGVEKKQVSFLPIDPTPAPTLSVGTGSTRLISSTTYATTFERDESLAEKINKDAQQMVDRYHHSLQLMRTSIGVKSSSAPSFISRTPSATTSPLKVTPDFRADAQTQEVNKINVKTQSKGPTNVKNNQKEFEIVMHVTPIMVDHSRDKPDAGHTHKEKLKRSLLGEGTSNNLLGEAKQDLSGLDTSDGDRITKQDSQHLEPACKLSSFS